MKSKVVINSKTIYQVIVNKDGLNYQRLADTAEEAVKSAKAALLDSFFSQHVLPKMGRTIRAKTLLTDWPVVLEIMSNQEDFNAIKINEDS